MATIINANNAGITQTVDLTASVTFQTANTTALIVDNTQNINCASTAAFIVPQGTTAQRPTASAGMLRYNTSNNVFEAYAANWTSITLSFPPVNTVAPVISGSAAVGGTLTSTTGTWTNTPTGYYYLWLANSTAITNATANTFTLTSTQIGANIACNVTAFNAVGNSSPATSNTLGPVLNTYSADYLVIAGGGGAGTGVFANGNGGGGGGGAGGYLANTATFTPGVVYTATIGGGGAGGAPGTQGTTSTISGSGLTTISSTGGGYGGRAGAGSVTGGAGGSGGGGGSAGSGGAGTSGQGNNGSNPTIQGGGGGGGAGNSSGSSNGGSGASSSITGSAVTRAGGGGGGGRDGNQPTGGSGGGGTGGLSTGNTNGTAGSVNTGSGGGGGCEISGSDPAQFGGGGSGGSGVIILSVPTSRYSGTQSGASVTTSGSNTILTFNSSGTYTA